MKRRKTLQELTIKDNFMFGAVMCDEGRCHRFLEMALGFPIERVEISKEKCMVYHPQYKGVRLDVYAKDENNTHYNVEMQAVLHAALPRRARYYHSQIDMELLMSGASYAELPNSYVIFICDFDPFERGKYRYTFRNYCDEIADLSAEDGNITIFLSTRGINAEEVSKELVKFLEYVSADLEESTENFEDDFVKSLQEAVSSVKRSREMGDRFMLLELMLQDERREGRAEGRAEECVENIIQFLEDLSAVPEELREKIESEKDLSVLKRWLKFAAKANSIEQFISEM